MRSYIALLLLSVFIPVQAQTIDALLNSGKLQINSHIDTEKPIIAKQEVKLWIDIKTQTWFAGGSRIVLPEIKNTVVNQPNAFAINSTKKEAGKTWTTQRWGLSLYPQNAGTITIPPIAIKVVINNGSGGVITGVIYTKAATLDVSLPHGETSTDEWIATPSFTIERITSPKHFKALRGESFQLTVTSTAENLMPMMIPPFALDNIKGLAIYPQLPQLQHKTQRGDNTAIRRDTIDIVIEQEVEHIIAAQQYRWWNTQKGEMQTTTLPALKLIPGEGVAVIKDEAAKTFEVQPELLLATVILLLIAIGLFLFYKNRWTTNQVTERQLRQQIRHALKQNQLQQAFDYLYCWMALYQGTSNNNICLRHFAQQLGDARFSSELDALLKAAFGNNQSTLQKPLSLKLPRRRHDLWLLWNRKTTDQKLDLTP